MTSRKARMGRRIWKGKDVYMKDEETRVKVDREAWKEKVNFAESKRAVEPRPRVRKYLGKNFDPVLAKTRSQRS